MIRTPIPAHERVVLAGLAAFGLLHPCDAQVTSTEPKPQTKSTAAPGLTDAPHLFHRDDGSVIARWVTDGKVQQEQFAPGKPSSNCRPSAA